MGDSETTGAPAAPLDVGEYCRRVEEHLTRVNAGQIIRIAGIAFDLVRRWAHEGIPLSIVYLGIDQKAARHQAGRSTRPLRLEFCENDVRAAYEDWRRAVGVWHEPGDAVGVTPPQEERRRPSPVRQVDRAIERVVAASGRADTPGHVAELLTTILEDMVRLRDDLRRARGAARQALADRAGEIDRAIGDAARLAAGPDADNILADAARELAAFRSRMPAAAWDRSVQAAADRLFRERSALPHLDIVLTGDGSERS